MGQACLYQDLPQSFSQCGEFLKSGGLSCRATWDTELPQRAR